jgi:chromosome segregation ATPase
MHGKMSVIAEGHQMLVGRMDRLDTKMDKGFQEQNRQRELSNKALTKRIDQVESSLGQRIDQVAGEVREVRAEVRELRTDIREHTEPRLDDHETRLTALEGKPAA